MSERKRRARLHDIAQIAHALREPVETPDFTTSILERVHAEKPFIGPKTRRWVPVVRIGAATVALLGVFVMTLIIFVKPDLPEQLGAPPSITSELVQSTEDGVVTRVAALGESFREINRGAHQMLRKCSAPVVVGAELAPIAAAIEPDPAPLSVMPARSESYEVGFVTFPTTMPTPVAIAMPEVPAPMAGDLSDYTAFVRGALVEQSFAAEARTGVAWQRAAIASQPWRGRPMTFLATSPGFRPRVNPESPPLVKELFPLITGQPAGDELQIR